MIEGNPVKASPQMSWIENRFEEGLIVTI